MKKSLIFTLIFGLLAGKSTFAMHDDDRLNKMLTITNAFSVVKSFFIGLYTPQKGFAFDDYQTADEVKKAYLVAQFISGSVIAHTGVETGWLNNLVHGTSKYDVVTWMPVALNFIAYGAGALLRNYTDTRDPRKDSLVPTVSLKATEIVLGAFWVFFVPCFTLIWKTFYNDTFQRLNEHIHQNGSKIDLLRVSPACIQYILNQKPLLIFDTKNVTNAINSLDKNQLDRVLHHATQTYNQRPGWCQNNFIDCFIKVITSYQKPSPEQLKLLVHFFEKFQTLGCDISKYNGLSDLLKACNAPVHEEMVAEKYMHALVHDVIKYCVEMGMSLYKTKCQSCNKNIITHMQHNSTMKNYLKMVGRYNKTLLTDKANLGAFLQKLSLQQKDVIFCIAASRGHLHTLTVLAKLHPKQYSLTQAAHLALHRNLEKVLITYFSVITDLDTHFRKTIKNPQTLEFLKHVKAKVDYDNSHALDTIFQKNDINNGAKEVITLHIKDMLLRAAPAKFEKMVKELRTHQEEFEYRSLGIIL